MKNIKQIANKFIDENSIVDKSYSSLIKITEKLGYTVVEFSSIFNDEDTDEIIKLLKLEDKVKNSAGFTYVSEKYRLVFINEDLGEEEKSVVLSHELGHIVCGHFNSNVPFIGKTVNEEYEANEFSHYLLHQSFSTKLKTFFKHKKRCLAGWLVIIFVLAAVVSACLYQGKMKSYREEYVVTESGSRYHHKYCYYVKNKDNLRSPDYEEIASGKYTPCKICITN